MRRPRRSNGGPDGPDPLPSFSEKVDRTPGGQRGVDSPISSHVSGHAITFIVANPERLKRTQPRPRERQKVGVISGFIFEPKLGRKECRIGPGSVVQIRVPERCPMAGFPDRFPKHFEERKNNTVLTPGMWSKKWRRRCSVRREFQQGMGVLSATILAASGRLGVRPVPDS